MDWMGVDHKQVLWVFFCLFDLYYKFGNAVDVDNETWDKTMFNYLIIMCMVLIMNAQHPQNYGIIHRICTSRWALSPLAVPT